MAEICAASISLDVACLKPNITDTCYIPVLVMLVVDVVVGRPSSMARRRAVAALISDAGLNPSGNRSTVEYMPAAR